MALTLRDYQLETINRLIQNYEENKRRNLCVLATGLGKTVIATEFHKRFKPNEKTIFLVDRIELAFQARDSFRASDPSLRVGVEMNKYHADERDDVVIACTATIGRKGSYRIGKFTPEMFSKVIVDEAHMAVSESNSRILNYLGVGPDNLLDGKMLVGLTATPNRTDGVGLQTVFDEITVNFDMKYGIKNGWLTDIDLITVQTATDISHVKATKNDFNIEQLGKVLNNNERNKLIYKAYKELGNNQQALVFTADVKHAHAVAAMFNEAGIASACIEANTDSDDRKKYVEDYKEGKIRILTNYGTLTVGFDAPETSCIILGRPIKSELLLRQIIGRGVRPSRASFIDAFKKIEDRLDIINSSVKARCQVIDMHDIFGQHDIISVPSLFGLSPMLQMDTKQEKFFQSVVEVLEQAQLEHQIDITKIDRLEDLDMIVKHKKLNITALETPEEISRHTARPWLPIGDDQYEIVFSKDKKSLVIKKNMLDKFELIEYDSSKKMAKMLQDFYDLSSAVKLGDEYATQFYDTTFVDKREEWKSKGVTIPQYKQLVRLYKGGIRVDRYETYPDTKAPVLYYRKTGDKLDMGTASDLIGKRFQK